ncbi:CHC2 zinc finger domain-containing protein [Desulfocurvibacter africanus]|uniref:CHC2 zinc finger domain-containing protein n=1 Tax=Desulfocurvibacter africanus TaxID=873 RepID=UPI000409AEDC|nr:CHC2 zinc finger domain-containing protein [Desulfocurvibacter africanus]
MAKALEWLGPDGCRAVALQMLQGVDTRGCKGSLIASHCPFHVESTPGGAFHYDYAKDSGSCFSCGEHGDLIHIFNRLAGRDGDDDDGFREFRDRFAPSAELGQRQAAPRVPAPRPEWTPRMVRPAVDSWLERAEKLVSTCSDRLMQSPDLRTMLARWSIEVDTARLCRLGWLPTDKYSPRESWGLPTELRKDGKPKRFWIPQGLVLPYVLDGKVVAVKIRRPNPEQRPGGKPGLRYMGLEGGMPVLYLYGNPAWRIWFVVETERDGVLGWQIGRKYRIGVVATGSATARPDTRTHGVLTRADCIACALDTDKAGATNRHFWHTNYPQTVRTPVPARLGKDLGDLGDLEKGGSAALVEEFMLEALPFHVRKQALRNAGTSAPVQVPASAPVEGNQPSQAEQAKPAELPEGVRALLDALRKCRRAAAVATDEHIGVEGCDDCPRRGTCDILATGSQILMNDDAVLDYVAAQPEGRLRG